MKSRRMALAVLCTCALVPLLAQTPIREGSWETIVQMDIPNAPVKMPEMKAVRCITQENIDNPSSLAPANPGSDCKVTDQQVSGNKVTWKMACTGAQSMTGSGELVFDGDTYKGIINATTDQGAMALKLSGRRLGACTK